MPPSAPEKWLCTLVLNLVASALSRQTDGVGGCLCLVVLWPSTKVYAAQCRCAAHAAQQSAGAASADMFIEPSVSLPMSLFFSTAVH